MGSSYRSDLKAGRMRAWETSLRSALDTVKAVADEVTECIGSDGQIDNAGDDMALQERLLEVVGILREMLPLTPEERADRIKWLEWELAQLRKAVL